MSTYQAAIDRFPTLRQSRLATFDRCGLSAKFEDDYRAGWSGHPQARGTIFHRFAGRALQTMSEMGSRTLPTDAAVEILEDCLRQEDSDRECPTCKKPVVRFVAESGLPRIRCEAGHEHSSDFMNLPMSEVKDLRWVVVKWANDNAFDIENLVDVEQRLAATVRYQDPAGDYVERRLTGALDAVFVTGEEDDHAVVLDWKDTWALPGPTDVGFDGYFQQRFYAWLVFRNFPTIERVTLREFYVRYSSAREASVWRADMEDVERELGALAERFDRSFTEEVFPPSPGVHCQFCPRPVACPIFTGVRGEGSINDEETAKRYGQEATVAKRVLAQRTQALKAWTAAHTGGVEVSDHKGKRVWGHREIQRVARPDRETMQSALANAGAAGLDLDGLYRESKGTRFELHQPKPVEDTADDAKLMSALEKSLRSRS